jgi:hypothetical protein
MSLTPSSSLKVRAGGLSTNITIHRHFWERSPTWQRVYAEEQASMEQATGEDNTRNVDQEEPEDAEIDVKGAKREANKLQFDPIDARFLSSSQLVRSRMIKLLKNAQNQTHFYTNLIFAIVSFYLFKYFLIVHTSSLTLWE